MYSVPVFSFRRCSVNVVGRGGRICSTPDCILSFLKVNARMLSASDITTRTERRISVDSPKYYKFAFADRLAIPKRSTSHSHLHVHRSRPLFAPDVTCNAGLVRSISFNSTFYCARQLPILFHSHEPQFAYTCLQFTSQAIFIA